MPFPPFPRRVVEHYNLALFSDTWKDSTGEMENLFASGIQLMRSGNLDKQYMEYCVLWCTVYVYNAFFFVLVLQISC